MTPVLTASDYVQEGLIFQLDGIERGDNPNYWQDLKSESRFSIRNNVKTDKYVSFPPSFNLQRAIGSNTSTLELSISNYTQTTRINEVMVQKGPCLGLQINNSKYAIFQTSNSSLSNSSPSIRKAKIFSIKSNEIVADGIKIPVNRHFNWDATDNNYLGGEAQVKMFDGRIYSVRIYNRRLTDDEILYNQRVDNLRFNLGLDLNGGIQPYTPGRELTMSRNIALDEASPLESFDESLSTEEEECVNVTER